MRSGLMYKLNPDKYLEDKFDMDANVGQRSKIATDLVEYYSNREGILGIILVGSLQGKPRDKFSDFDFFIIYEGNIPAESERRKFIENHVKSKFIYCSNYVSKEYGTSDDFDWSEIEVCTTFYSLTEARRFIFDLHKNKDYKRKGFYYPMASVAAIADGTILFEKDNAVTLLKKQCKMYPNSLKEKILIEERGFLDYYLDRMALAIYRKDVVYFNDLINLFVDSALQIVFAHNKEYLYSRKELNKKIERLEEKPDNLFESICALLKNGDAEPIDLQKSIHKIY